MAPDSPEIESADLGMLPSWVDPRAGVVLDIGANEGSGMAAALQAFPGLEVIAAEPGPEPLSVLETRFAKHENATADPGAITLRAKRRIVALPPHACKRVRLLVATRRHPGRPLRVTRIADRGHRDGGGRDRDPRRAGGGTEGLCD